MEFYFIVLTLQLLLLTTCQGDLPSCGKECCIHYHPPHKPPVKQNNRLNISRFGVWMLRCVPVKCRNSDICCSY